ncbi:MAG: hypothetical protein DMG22_23260, partial [Acidobacteria bacterium]
MSYHSIGKQHLARRKDVLFKWKSTWPRTDHNSLKQKFLRRNSLTLLLAFLSWLSLTACGSVSQTGTTTGTPPPPSGTGHLSVSRTSMDFGNVVVGSISTQIVTLSNSGNGGLTVSPPQVTGSDFSVNGLMFPLALGPGQSSNLSVAFAPKSVASETGSISIVSDASASPVTVNLSGSGFTPPSGLLACGTFGDSSNHVPTDWTSFVPPGKGQSYVDPTFGCTVTRVTDASSEVWSGSFFLPLSMGYATVSPFNANDTYLMLSDGWRRYFVTDLSGNVIVPLSNMPAMNDTWVLWDAADPPVFYYTNGNALMKGTISGSSVTPATVHQFMEYAAINFMDKTDL